MPAGITLRVLLYLPAMMTDRNRLMAAHTARLPRAEPTSMVRLDRVRIRAAPSALVSDFWLPAFTNANTPPTAVQRTHGMEVGGGQQRQHVVNGNVHSM